MSDTDHTPGTDEQVGNEPRRTFRFPVKSLIALVFIVLLGLPTVSMLHPGYFERYPDLKVRMKNWSTSTHARIPCSGCHVEPGVRGAVDFWAKSIPAFYSQLLHGPRPANLLPVPGRKACQKCHTSYRQVSANGDLLIPHRAHVEIVEVDCAVCHSELVHAPNEAGFNKPAMAGCLTACHDGKKAHDKCVKCHTRKQVPQDHRQADWLQTHSTRTEEVNCGECHGWSPDYCKECHSKRPKSHEGNWKKAHQYRVEERGSKGCFFCHKSQKFCKDCHD